MKRRLIGYVIACSVLATVLVGASGAANLLRISGNNSGSEADITPQQVYKCWVSVTIMGGAVKTIRASRYSTYSYWVNYHHGTAMNHNLKFVIVFIGVGARCVIKKETMELTFPYPPGYGGGAYSNVPFAVTDWGGGVEHGPAYVVPVVDGVYQWAYRYWFTVTG
jgi:hypothetical protein